MTAEQDRPQVQLTFNELDRLTEEELYRAMRSAARLFRIYSDQGREAMAGVWAALLEALNREWERREEGAVPRAIRVAADAVCGLKVEELGMLLKAVGTVRDESRMAGRAGKADLYGTMAGALEAEARAREERWLVLPDLGMGASPSMRDGQTRAA